MGRTGWTRINPASAPSRLPSTIETTEIWRVRSVAAPISGKYCGICSQCQVYTRRYEVGRFTRSSHGIRTNQV